MRTRYLIFALAIIVALAGSANAQFFGGGGGSVGPTGPTGPLNYTGAAQDLNLGTHALKAGQVNLGNGAVVFQPLVYTLGAEILTNGDLHLGNATGWTLSQYATYSSGSVSVVYSGSSGDTLFSYGYDSTTFTGKNYLCTIVITAGDSGMAKKGVQIYSNSGDSELFVYSPGTYTIPVVYLSGNAGSTSDMIVIAGNNGPASFTVASISLKPISALTGGITLTNMVPALLSNDDATALGLPVGTLYFNVTSSPPSLGIVY